MSKVFFLFKKVLEASQYFFRSVVHFFLSNQACVSAIELVLGKGRNEIECKFKLYQSTGRNYGRFVLQSKGPVYFNVYLDVFWPLVRRGPLVRGSPFVLFFVFRDRLEEDGQIPQ